jgi:hypothetical protein
MRLQMGINWTPPAGDYEDSPPSRRFIGHNQSMAARDARTTRSDAGIAERLLEVIDSGRRTATYKLALLLALVDLCARQSDQYGRAVGAPYA